MTLEHFIKGAMGRFKSYIPIFRPEPEIIEKRLKLCEKCDSLISRTNSLTKKISYKCNECGCPIDKKILVNTEKCPRGFW